MLNSTPLDCFANARRTGFRPQPPPVHRLPVVLFVALGIQLCLALAAIAQPCSPAPSGLVSWFRGETNANDSAGTATGSFVGTAAYAAGEVGQAFSFNGAGTFIQVTGA